jgi:hypothetical protein
LEKSGKKTPRIFAKIISKTWPRLLAKIFWVRTFFDRLDFLALRIFSKIFTQLPFSIPKKRNLFFLGPRLSKKNRLDFIPLFWEKSWPQTFTKKNLANGTGKNTQ